MKKLIYLVVLLASPALAQYTQVTSLLKDANGTAYQNCHYSVVFVGQSSQPGPYLMSGSVFQTSYQGASCDGFGNLSIKLPQNSAISPTPSQWEFDFCDQTGKYCNAGGSAVITISGSSQDISSQLTAVAPILPGGGGGGGAPPAGLANSIQTKLDASHFGTAAGTVCPPSTGATPSQCQMDWLNGVPFVTPDYNFNTAPSSPATLAAGPSTVTFSVCPVGVLGTSTVANDLPHFIQINPAVGDTSPAAPVLITGGTCAIGSLNSTITFDSPFAYAAGYKIGSATYGIQEAIRLNAIGPSTKIELIPGQTYACTAPVFMVNGSSILEGNYAPIYMNSFGPCIVMGESGYYAQGSSPFTGEQITVQHMLFLADQTLWSVQPTGAIAGGTSTLTLTIPTCPAGFWAAIPNQLLWIAGTASGRNTTVWGYGEYGITTGGTCAPGVTNGTVALANVSFQPANFGAHDHGFTLSNNVGPYIEDNVSLHGSMQHIRINATGAGGAGSGIQVDTDQACTIYDLNADTQGGAVRNDVDYQGKVVFAPGPDSLYAAICDISGSDIAGASFGVDWLGGNDLSLHDTILQNHGVAFIRVGNKRGGFGKFRIQNNHFEGSGNAPFGVLVGVPDISVVGTPRTTPLETSGNVFRVAGVGGSNAATYPKYLDVGGATASQFYYLAAHNNSITSPTNCTVGGDCITVPVAIGCASVTDPSINNVPVIFMGWGVGNLTPPDTGVSTYDLLAVSSATPGCLAPPVAPTGTGTYAVTTGLTPAAICDIHDICTITDNVAPGSRTSYSVTGSPTPGKGLCLVDLFGEGQIYLGCQDENSISGTNPVGAAMYKGQPAGINSMQGIAGNGLYAAYFTDSANTVSNGINTINPISIPAGTGGFCWSAAGTCNASSSGTSTIAASATTVTISTSAVTPYSRFQITEDSTQGAQHLGVTCNTTLGRTYAVTSVTVGVSFTITSSAAPTTDPACLDWKVDN